MPTAVSSILQLESSFDISLFRQFAGSPRSPRVLLLLNLLIVSCALGLSLLTLKSNGVNDCLEHSYTIN